MKKYLKVGVDLLSAREFRARLCPTRHVSEPVLSGERQPVSRGRIPEKEFPRMDMTTNHKRAKPRHGFYLTNDFRRKHKSET